MFNIMYTACDTLHTRGEIIYHTEKRDFFILIYTKTNAVFSIDGHRHDVEAGSILLLPPEAKAFYYGHENEYIDDWINFFDSQGMLISMCASDREGCRGIPLGKPLHFGSDSYIGGYFSLIANAFHSALAAKDTITDNLMLALFELLHSHCTDSTELIPHYNTILSARQGIYANPRLEYSVPSLADSAGLSTVYFQELYKKAFGISCGADIINSRIENAKRLLSETSYTIEQIAERCGYHSIVHFSRQFKQAVGTAPSKWRCLLTHASASQAEGSAPEST